MLERIRTAVGENHLPFYGHTQLYDTNATSQSLAYTFQTLFTGRSLDRNKHVGAAGELFVSARKCDLGPD